MHVARILESVSEVRQNERKARVARAFIVSFSAVFVAALSHVLAGGNTPAVISFAGATILALPLTLFLTNKRFGIAGTFSAIAAAQAIFHWIFVYLGVSSGGPNEPLPAHAEHFGMVQSFVPVIPAQAGADIAMWLSHGVAAVITVVLIRHGDVALTRLARVLTRVLWPMRQLQVPFIPRAIVAKTQSVPATLHSTRLAFHITHRGPPELNGSCTLQLS